jgi:hypothetical protein
MEQKMKRFIVKPQAIEGLVHHDISKMEQEIGPLFKFMDREMVPESDVTLLVRQVNREVKDELSAGPSPHTHEVNQLYCLLGDLELEVALGAEKHRVKGPASILVPSGMQHAIRFAGGKGYLVNVLSGGRYR